MTDDGIVENCTETAVDGAELPVSEFVSLERLAHGAERIGGMVVRSVQVRKVLKTISRLGPHKASVLICGESGTGKELVARALHMLGPTPNAPFVIFNCSNLVESLAESQLFGHVRGAFTDARENSEGFFRAANGGTLFLDEIGELPLKLQPKLLRAVETHEVQPVGSSQCYRVDIRLIAATNRDLRAMVKTGEFRDDLYYRLNTAAIFIPPLRERREAIPAFVAHFVQQFNGSCGKNIKLLAHQSVEALCSYSWPGNVRELAHAIESAVIQCDGERLMPSDLPAHVLDGTDSAMLPDGADESAGEVLLADGVPIDGANGRPGGFLLDDIIKKTLVRSLDETGGNRRRAAGLLGVSRSTLYRMLSRYGIEEERIHASN
ncbi:MAG TPA: sigma-54 dependent transcriptional regulator [Candidatus Binataceae bacterium]|nr:sigma-54 dependent transcriptional regulator [Candidatus Binataceae bacterium]